MSVALQRRHIDVLAAITGLGVAGDSMLYIVLPLYWQESGLSSIWEVGFILSLNRLARLPINPIAGWLYSRISIRTGMIAGALCALASTCGYALAGGFLLWCLLRVLWGTAWSLFKIGSMAAVLEVSNSGGNGYLIGRYNGLLRLGSLLGMFGGGLVADCFGFRITCVLCAVLAAPALLLALFQVPDVSVQPSSTKRSSSWWKDMATLPGLPAALLTAGAIAVVLQGVLAAGLGSLTQEHFGDTLDLGLLIVGCASLTGVLQAIRWTLEPVLAPRIGGWTDRSGKRPCWLAGALLATAVVFAVSACRIPLVFWLPAVVGMELCAIAVNTLSDAVITDIAKATGRRMSIVTSYVFAVDLGAALGPLLLFGLGRMADFTTVYVVSAGLMLICAACWSVLGRRS